MSTGSEERRRNPRQARPEDHRIVAARVRPGYEVSVVNVSAAGVLIESSCRLLPGTSVELHVETDTRHIRVRGQVLRCAVVGLRPTAVCYQGAIRFDRHLPWFVDESGNPINSPDSRPLHPVRAATTPEVI